MRLPRLVPKLAAVLVLAGLAIGLPGCAPEDSQGQLMYRVKALDGSPPTAKDLSDARSRLDIRLLEAGYERRDVSPIPPDRVRVVLPENVVGQLAEIRALLEDPDDLPVQIELLSD